MDTKRIERLRDDCDNVVRLVRQRRDEIKWHDGMIRILPGDVDIAADVLIRAREKLRSMAAEIERLEDCLKYATGEDTLEQAT